MKARIFQTDGNADFLHKITKTKIETDDYGCYYSILDVRTISDLIDIVEGANCPIIFDVRANEFHIEIHNSFRNE